MWILAMAMALAAVLASFLRLRKVRGAVSYDLSKLSSALGRTASLSRLCELREAMRGETETWESELVSIALDTERPEDRVALVNEVLNDVDAALVWGGWVPVASARLSALGPFCLLFFGLARGGAALTALEGWYHALARVLPILAWSGVGVVGALSAGREADRVAADARSAVDMWVKRVLDAAGATKSEPRESGP